MLYELQRAVLFVKSFQNERIDQTKVQESASQPKDLPLSQVWEAVRGTLKDHNCYYGLTSRFP